MKYFIAIIISLSLQQHSLANCYFDKSIVSKLSENYIDHGDGTITDIETGLMWQKCTVGKTGESCELGASEEHTWLSALAYAQSNSLSNFSNWRLPNIKELTSIIDERCEKPAINSSIFPNTDDAELWSSTPAANASFWEGENAWAINGTFVYTLDKDTALHIKLVRDTY